MNTIISVIVLLVCMSVVAGIFYRMAKSAGENEKEVKHVKQTNEILHENAQRMANRPRSANDVSDRLRKWIDRS